VPHEHHISSLLVHARPENLPAISADILDLGCEIHGTSEAGKLVVTFETDSGAALSEVLTRLQLIDGVLAATLVFHHVEPSDDPDGPQAESLEAAPERETRSCR
jgi:nitrate reductase NapD